MSRLAYLWVIFAVGFAFWFHSHEESQRRADISRATKSALTIGVSAGCRSNNDIRKQIDALAHKLHPEVVVNVPEQNCEKEVARVISDYRYHEDGGK